MNLINNKVLMTMLAAAITVLTVGEGMSQSVEGVAPVPTATTVPAPTPMPTATPNTVTENGNDDQKLDDSAEAAAILPYYNNYLKEYRLGPSDVITVEVFGQCPEYCKQNITIPPNARISYPLIRDGVLVAGKTVEQVADDITKELDEYIIDPKVTVSLEKAMSMRYSVLGRVGTPGVRVMDRKVSVYEAIVEAGGVAKDGNRKKVVIYSYAADGRLSPRTIDLSLMEKGKGEMIFLSPGDQVFVPGKGLTLDKVLDILSKASTARLLFGSPF